MTGKLVRQLSEDFIIGNDGDDDGDDDEYVEDVVEDTEEEEMEEIISSSEEQDSYYDEDSDEVELESIEESEGQDDSTSRSDFDPLPPPIHIPNALKPPHLRDEEKASGLLGDSDGSTSGADDSSDDDSAYDFTPKKGAAAKNKTASKATKFSYDDNDAEDVSSGSDSDSSSSSEEEKKGTTFTVASVKGTIDKNADSYDEDDEEEEEKEASKTSVKQEHQSEAKASELMEDPATAIRPTSFRGNSFVSDDDITPETEKRGGKKPSKWEDQPSSIYQQNGVSTVQKSNFTKPTEPEARTISEHRPTGQLGMSDASTLRDSSTVKNEAINPSPDAGSAEKEKTQTRKSQPVVTKKEEKVEEDDWNTEPKDDGNGPYYSYEDLRKKKIPGLDYLNREQYLSPYDFMAVFKVKKAEYETWPKWKKTKAKRKVKLF